MKKQQLTIAITRDGSHEMRAKRIRETIRQHLEGHAQRSDSDRRLREILEACEHVRLETQFRARRRELARTLPFDLWRDRAASVSLHD